MFHPLSLFIGLRYTRAKRRNHFISFISLISMLGIALGVATLITVLSVMNGFDYEIQHRIFDMANQVTVSSVDGLLNDWPALKKTVDQMSMVKKSAPFLSGQGMVAFQGHAAPLAILGVDPSLESQVSNIPQSMVKGRLDLLTPQGYGIILGEALAEGLGIIVGDKVNVIIPQATATPFGLTPRYRVFKVVGIFHVEGNSAYDRSVALINLRDAQALYSFGQSVSGLRLKVSDLYAAPKVSTQLQEKLPPRYIVSNWTQEYGTYFRAIRMEKSMIFFILILIVAVAAFNLVSTLVMVVTDKRAEIAILRTIGATPKMIMATFIVQGCIVGVVGTLLGLAGGILLALNATQIVNFIQKIFHMDFISSSIYFIDYLPSRIEWSDVWQICSIAFVLSLLATLYPAWHASRTQPADALRYE